MQVRPFLELQIPVKREFCLQHIFGLLAFSAPHSGLRACAEEKKVDAKSGLFMQDYLRPDESWRAQMLQLYGSPLGLSWKLFKS